MTTYFVHNTNFNERLILPKKELTMYEIEWKSQQNTCDLTQTDTENTNWMHF